MLRIVRNCVFHPAHQRTDAGSGSPPILGLIELLSAYQEPESAAGLTDSWAYLSERSITTFALRMLNAAGREQAEYLGIRVR